MKLRTGTCRVGAVALACMLASCGGEDGNAAVCGNGIREDPEVCDVRDAGGKTCRDFGFADGQLTCTDLCQADTSGCSQTVFDDCRHIESSCQAPFVCIPGGQPDDYKCGTPVTEIPTCTGSPTDLAVPFNTTYDTSIPIHWTLAEGCIPVTHEPGLANLADMISSAIAAFNDVSCSRLCLGSPQPSSVEPDLAVMERRLHVRLNSDIYDPALTTTTYELTSGRMINNLIEIRTDFLDQIDQAGMLHLFGLACGLASVASGTDSVMAMPVDSNRTALSSADEQSLCRLYGEPSYCGE